MTNSKFLSMLFFLVCINLHTPFAYGWSVENHKTISEIAAEYSILSVNHGNFAKFNLGLEAGLNEILAGSASTGDNLSALNMIELGSINEDAFCWQTQDISCLEYAGRFNHHYHNPLKKLENAGLNDIWTGSSSLLWSQDDKQTWSWNNLRDFYYEAFTSKDLTWGERRLLLAYTFLGIGHQLHLIQDKGVPYHVRNDSHVKEQLPSFIQRLGGGLYFESWAEAENNQIKLFANTSIDPEIDLTEPYENIDKLPVAKLIDTRTYFETGTPSASLSTGLAEFTNANFFSADTIFAAERYANNLDHKHYFPYPRESETNLQEFIDEESLPARRNEFGETEFAISMVSDRMEIEHFVQPTYFTRELDPQTDQYVYLRSFYLSEKCHADYVRELVPRASGYSTALIDYFFRGAIEISLPEDGLYAFIDSDVDHGNIHSVGFDRIALMARNTSLYGEALNNGSIELVVTYNTLDHDYPFESFTSIPPYSGPFYTVVPEASDRRSIPDTPVKLEFDLHETPIPLTATDLTLHVIYRGELGAETEKGVAVGFKDISEPTPVVMFNTCDNICMNGSWYDAGSQAAIRIVDYNENDVANPAYIDEDGVYHPSEWDVYPHDARDICFGFHPVDNPRTPDCQGSGNGVRDFSIDYLSAGDYHRVIILSDYALGMTINPSAVALPFGNCPPQFAHPWQHDTFRGGRLTLSAVKHKTELVGDNAPCGGHDPCYVRFLPGFTLMYGTESRSSLFFINREYPANSDPSQTHCSFEDLED